MNKQQLIHVISAACRQLECQELYLFGSQASYGTLDEIPTIVATSNEADLTPKKNPERAIEISGGMGEFTRFHDEFDYYAHGIEFSEMTLPNDWQENLVDISFIDHLTKKTLTVYCLYLYDLCASKLAAGRPKDFEFVKYIFEILISINPAVSNSNGVLLFVSVLSTFFFVLLLPFANEERLVSFPLISTNKFRHM